MRIVAYAASALLVAALFSPQAGSQNTQQSDAAKEKGMFATTRYLSKGGIGMISEELYVVVKSSRKDKNELIVKPPGHLGTDQSAPVPETRWKGKSASQAEAAIFFRGKVWSSLELPDRFDLSKAVIISFEGDKIRFLDFQTMAGGYYERIRD